MNAAERVDRSLSGLRNLKAPEAEPGEAARRRRRIVGQLQTASLERSVRKKLLLSGAGWLGVAVAAAILLAVGLGWWSRSASGGPGARVLATTGMVQVTGDAGQQELAATLAPDAEIATLEGSSAKLETQSGVRIALGSRSRLRIAGRFDADGIERVELSSGRIDVSVPKLGPERQFRVVTPDAVVIVHGTEFTVVVSRAKSGSPRSEVRVTTGRVEVRRKSDVVFLSGGKAWSSTGGARKQTAPATPKAQPDSSDPAQPPDDRQQARSAGPPSKPKANAQTAAAKSSRLARANALLARAQAAARSGNDQAALRHLEELLGRFGDSPVAASARVERFRALKRLGRDAEAARAADDYLEKEHDGLARDEARALGK
jgi:hypothetical protein